MCQCIFVVIDCIIVLVAKKAQRLDKNISVGPVGKY